MFLLPLLRRLFPGCFRFRQQLRLCPWGMLRSLTQAQVLPLQRAPVLALRQQCIARFRRQMKRSNAPLSRNQGLPEPAKAHRLADRSLLQIRLAGFPAGSKGSGPGLKPGLRSALPTNWIEAHQGHQRSHRPRRFPEDDRAFFQFSANKAPHHHPLKPERNTHRK